MHVPVYACEKVIITCRGSLISEDDVMYAFVHTGDEIEGTDCVVQAVSHPHPELVDGCLISDSTGVEIKKVVPPEVVYRDDEVSVIRDNDFAYVYDTKVIDEIMNEIVKPIVNMESDIERGLLLMGPPGTGKSSLTNWIANTTGFYAVEINPTEIYSKWLGETEANLKRKLDEAKENEPSIVRIDDLEWLAMSRSFAGSSSMSTGEWRFSMFNVLASFFDEINKKSLRVLVIGATNVNKDMLDPALIREGRFGMPKLIPPPSLKHVDVWFKVMLENIKPTWLTELIEMLEEKGISKNPEEDVREWMRRLVMAGAPMSDIVVGLKSMFTRLKYGASVKRDDLFEYRISAGLGFRRAYPRSPNKRLGKYGESFIRAVSNVLKSEVFPVNGKVYIYPYINEASPLASTPYVAPLIEAIITMAASAAGKPVIVITNINNVENAITMAELMKAIIFIDIPEYTLKYHLPTLLNAQAPVILSYMHSEFKPYFAELVIGTNMIKSIDAAEPYIGVQKAILDVVSVYYDIDDPNCVENAMKQLTYGAESIGPSMTRTGLTQDKVAKLLLTAFLAKNRKYNDCGRLITDTEEIRRRIQI